MKRLLASTTALSVALGSVQPFPLMAQTVAEDGSIIADDGTILCLATEGNPCRIEDFLPGGAKTEDAAKAAEEEAAKAAEEAAAQKAAEEEAAKAAEEAAGQQAAEEEAAKAAEEAAAQQAAAEEAAAQQAAEEEAATATEEATPETAPEAKPEETAPVVSLEPVPEDQVDLVAPTDEAIDTLSTLLAQPEANEAAPAEDGGDATGEATADPAATVAAAAALAATDPAAAEGPVDLAEMPAPTEADAVTVQQVTEATARSSAEEFRTEAKEGDTRTEAQKKRDRKTRRNSGKDRDDGDELSDLEKAGLVALGAVAVGMIVNAASKDRVVANSGDRVVVQRGNGDYAVYKDDDALLRQPGATVRTETFRDGSTRTIVQRADGTQIVTIRDATGRVLRRAAYDLSGREVLLVNDLAPETRVDLSTLPPPRGREITISGSEEDALLRARMAALDAEELGRSFSLRQIREIREVRALAASIDVNNVTFDSGSAAIKSTEAEELSALGRFMGAMIRDNPAEMFLIEGHTDAVGSAASNLALSDRRAESVALALTEYFGVPPENMIVQGYGESELRVDTQADERQNRRVAVRVITPLLRTASAN